MNKNKTFAVFACLGLFLSLSNIVKAEDAPTDLRFRYSGSSIFAVPTGKCTSSVSYINDNKDSLAFISQSFGELLEVSVLRRLSGANKNVNTICNQNNIKSKIIFLNFVIQIMKSRYGLPVSLYGKIHK